MSGLTQVRARRLGSVSRPAALPAGLVAGLPSLLGLALLVVLAPAHRVWLVSVVLLALTLTLPGVLLLRALAIPAATVAKFPLYVPAAAIFVVSLSGMAADLIGPHLGVARPLQGDSTELTVVGVGLVLWALGLRRPGAARLDWLGGLCSLRLLAPLALPLLAAAGALLLTNGHGGVVAAVAAVAMPVVLFATVAFARRLSRAELSVLLFACALAAEWAFSLLSQEIVGFDISTEVGLAQHVHNAGVWHANEVGNAYGAMLSLTVLPATLAQMTGISPLIAFKVLYPVFTAMLPVAIFLIADWFMPRRWAVAAAGLLLVQYYFFQQLAEIGRQEVGLLFFAGLVALLFDKDSRLGARLRLIAVLGIGLVVSHYSSTYFAIIFLALSIPACLLIPRLVGKRQVVMVLVCGVAVVGGGAAIYYGPVTHSASNLSSFTNVLNQDGFNLFPSSSGGLIKAYLNENTGYTVSGARYEQLAVHQYVPRGGYIHPLAAAHLPQYRLQSAAVPGPAGRFGLLSSVLSTFDTLFGQIMLLLVGVGSLLALFGRDRRIRMVGGFGLSMIVVLLVFRFSATLAASYNQTRALLQALLILAVPAGLLLSRLAGRLAPRYRQGLVIVVAGALALMFAIGDGATWLLVRGGQPMNLALAGEAHERFYETPAELTGARWVTGASSRRLVYADEYGVLRFAAAGTEYTPLEIVTPETIDRRAWVYASATNNRLGRARGDISSHSSIYRFPAAFLNRYYDTVFDDGDTKIWHR